MNPIDDGVVRGRLSAWKGKQNQNETRAGLLRYFQPEERKTRRREERADEDDSGEIFCAVSIPRKKPTPFT